ncbi:MAG: hypothetical protein ACK5XV_10185 [Flavobacteriales bacterium]|jgi:hypothetical protein
MKPAIKSKMQWFNVIIAVLALVELNYPLLSTILPASIGPYIFFGVAITNIILRQFFTKEPLTFK